VLLGGLQRIGEFEPGIAEVRRDPFREIGVVAGEQLTPEGQGMDSLGVDDG